MILFWTKTENGMVTMQQTSTKVCKILREDTLAVLKVVNYEKIEI